MKDEVTKDEIIIDYNYIINSADILKDITIERSDASNALAALEGISSNHSGLELNIDAFSTALDNINNLNIKVNNLGANMIDVANAYNNAEGDIIGAIQKIDNDLELPSTINKKDIITDKTKYIGNTQASEFAELGRRAYNEYGEITEGSARAEWLDKVSKIVQRSNKAGIKNSLVIAQLINESGWMNPLNERAKELLNINNVLGINVDLDFDNNLQNSSWSKTQKGEMKTVVQGWDSHLEEEEMRSYTSLEQAIEDYCDMVVTRHPEFRGSNNLDDYKSYLNGYTPYCTHEGGATGKYRDIIAKYGLEKYDQ